MSKAKILIVEDEGITALNIKAMLENWGYEDPLIASNSHEALRNVSKFEPDLILMDINLDEDIDGIEIVKNLQNTFDIPILYLTAHSDDAIVERAKLTRYYGYIIKPFDNEELKIAIDMALYRHKMENELKNANKLLQIELKKRKSAENELKKSEEKYRAIVETTHEGIVIIDEKNNLSYINEQMAEMMGYKVEEMIGLPVSIFLKNEHKTWIENELKKRRKGIKRTFEIPLYKKDGSCIWALISGSILFDSKNQYSGTLGMIKDISHRKKAEKALKVSEEKFRNIIQQSHDGIAIVNENGNLIEWNYGMEEITGYKQEEILGNSIWDVQYRLNHEEKRFTGLYNWLKASDVKIIKKGAFNPHNKLFEVEIQHAEGSKRVVQIRYFTIKTGKEKIIASIVRDVTEQKKFERELKKANDSLELKVQKRTRELKTSNEILKSEIEERKQAEEALIKSGNYLDKIINSIADPVFVKDKQHRWTLLNDAFCQLMGYPRKKLLGKSDYDFLPSHEADIFWEKDEEVFKTGVENVNEEELTDSRGNVHVVVTKKTLYTDISGEQYLVAVIRDITQLKKAEEGRKREHQKLMDIIEFLPDATFVIDQKGNVIAWNRAIEKMTGLSKEEVLGKGDYNYAMPFYGSKRPILIDLLLSQDNEIESFYNHVEREGDTLYADVFVPNNYGGKFLWGKASPLYDDKGNFVGAIESIRDISKRKKMEEQLKESKSRLKIAMDMAKLVYWEYDVDSDLFTFDDHFYKLYGTTTSKEGGSKMSSGEYARKFLLPEESHGMAEEISKSLETDDPNFFGQAKRTIIRADGEKRYIIVRHGIIKDDNGRTIKTYGANQDITEIKIAEEKMKKLITELKRSNDELQQFAYITSHDLQEPLRTIASFTQLLERRYKGQLDSDADEFIDYIVEASIRMKQMILDLLEYSRVARVEKKCEPLKIEKVLSNVLNSLNLLIKENNVKINYGYLPTVMADESQLFRVFQNLIENAIKFKKENGNPKIYISAEKDLQMDKYIFSVSDNGIGIERQYFDRIFTLFQRLHTREEYHGTGIGLSISKRIIENHGGKIWVESEPGVGSTFYFTLSNYKF